MSAAALQPAALTRRLGASGVWRAARGGLGWAVGALLCLTAPTAILAQGWLMGRLRQAAAGAAAARAQAAGEPAPDWARAAPPEGLARLRALVADGLGASITLFLGVLPFAALMALSWWAGWSNSFAKGYEQAWVGPTLGLLAAALALPLAARLPMALAHQAAERRMGAFFERRRVGDLMRAGRWEHVALAAAYVAAALPLLAAKGLPVFIEQIRPGFEDLSAQEVDAFRVAWRFGAALYLFAALWALRGWTGRLYAKARRRLEKEAVAGRGRRGGFGGALGGALGGWLRAALVWALWFGLVAQIYLGQFLNHHWASWLNPPLIGLPFAPPLG